VCVCVYLKMSCFRVLYIHEVQMHIILNEEVMFSFPTRTVN
jgi:hypothetical protein